MIEIIDSLYFVWFSLRPEATFHLLQGPLGFVPDAPPYPPSCDSRWDRPSMDDRPMPVCVVGSRTRHDHWPGIAMAFGVSTPAVVTNSPRPSPRGTDR